MTTEINDVQQLHIVGFAYDEDGKEKDIFHRHVIMTMTMALQTAERILLFSGMIKSVSVMTEKEYEEYSKTKDSTG